MQLGLKEEITQNEALSFKINYYEGNFKVIGNMRYRMESHSWRLLHKYSMEIDIRMSCNFDTYCTFETTSMKIILLADQISQKF